MIYAATRQEIEAHRKAFIRKWRLKHRAVADSLEEAGDRLFTFTRLPPSQSRSARTTTQSNDFTKSSSEGSKLKPCYPRQIPLRCCSGRCSRPVRSICERSMAGRRSPRTLSVSQLTWPPETIASCYRRSRHQIPTAFRTAPLKSSLSNLTEEFAHSSQGDDYGVIPRSGPYDERVELSKHRSQWVFHRPCAYASRFVLQDEEKPFSCNSASDRSKTNFFAIRTNSSARAGRSSSR